MLLQNYIISQHCALVLNTKYYCMYMILKDFLCFFIGSLGEKKEKKSQF